jgi:spoIIIJ-associated protein
MVLRIRMEQKERMMESGQAERGKQWVETLFSLVGVSTTVQPQSVEMAGEPSQWLVIDATPMSAEQVDVLTGSGGTVLDSLQYLTNAILNLGQPEAMQGAFTLELAGYRQQRYGELEALADQAAASVRETGQEYELKALSSAERRQVHTILKAFDDVATFSRGQEPDRRLVVTLASAAAATD